MKSHPYSRTYYGSQLPWGPPLPSSFLSSLASPPLPARGASLKISSAGHSRSRTRKCKVTHPTELHWPGTGWDNEGQQSRLFPASEKCFLALFSLANATCVVHCSRSHSSNFLEVVPLRPRVIKRLTHKTQGQLEDLQRRFGAPTLSTSHHEKGSRNRSPETGVPSVFTYLTSPSSCFFCHQLAH